MGDIYNWLYSNYVYSAMTATNRDQTSSIDEFVKMIPEEKRLVAHDFITYIRYQWGVEAFSLGVQMGIELMSGTYRDPNGHRILLDFLAKLDQPVA